MKESTGVSVHPSTERKEINAECVAVKKLLQRKRKMWNTASWGERSNCEMDGSKRRQYEAMKVSSSNDCMVEDQCQCEDILYSVTTSGAGVLFSIKGINNAK